MVNELAHVDYWIFDLDNTLYPSDSDLFAQIDQRMGEFISNLLKIEWSQAKIVQKKYFHKYGTTLRGLMLEYDMDPADFLNYVHNIDLTPIQPDPALGRALAALPGKKFVYTNGTVDHARRVLQRLGVVRHFDDIFDIIASDYIPKPDPVPFAVFVDRFDIAPRRAVMIEDMATNLVPAAKLGMSTVLVKSHHDGRPGDGEVDHVEHFTDRLTPWLDRVAHALNGTAA